MADFRVEELTGYGIATIMSRRGFDAATVGARLGGVAADGPRATDAGGLTLLGTGPSMWLALAPEASADWADDLSARLTGAASVSDQSSAYALLRLSGADAATVLRRGASIDLDPAMFTVGSVATTMISHIGVIIHHRDESPAYELAVFRSYKASLMSWLDHATLAL